MSKKHDAESKQDAQPKEPPKAAAPRPAPARRKAEPSIYVGPSLRGGRLARFTVFRGGVLPPHVGEIAEKHVEIARLIVPVSRLAATKRRLADPSSVEAAAFAKADKLFSKGGE